METLVMVKSHYCKDCDKSFNSGKALEGHKKLNAKRKSPTSTCSQCGRLFHSDKALYGHMRMHRKRPRRGTVPPPQQPTAEDEKEDVCGGGDDRIDCFGQKLGFHVRGWPTAKRGRPAMTIRPHSGSGSDKGPFVLALQLIKMLNAIDQKKPVIRAKGEEKLLLQNRNQNSETLMAPLMAEAAAGGGQIDPKDELLAIKCLASEMETVAPEVADTTTPPSGPESFKWNQCPESYSMYQVFRGHRSIHDKCNITKDCNFERAIRPFTFTFKRRPKKKGKVVSNSCSTNNVSVGDKGDESGEIKSSSAERGPAVPFTFDLNMEPPQEDEDEEMMMDQQAAGDQKQD